MTNQEPPEAAKTEQLETLLATPDLADALESRQFRRFLDQVPIAIAISELKDRERIVYANREFERLTVLKAAQVVGKTWTVLQGEGTGEQEARKLSEAIAESVDFVGTFKIERPAAEAAVANVYSNVIQDDEGTPSYRLAALVDVSASTEVLREEIEQKIREKDTLLLEIQHRVKNNLQMITALIRIEARNARGKMDTKPFDRLAGRIDSIQLIYKLLSEHEQKDEIDLGVYLSEIASSVMHSHAVEGIRLELKVDAYPVSVNVALPIGLVINELLTNALKHAFVGRDGGTISVQSLADGGGCRVVVADDGVGLPDGVEWPQSGKLGALIVQSLRENAKASLDVESSPGHGVKVTILYRRAAATA